MCSYDHLILKLKLCVTELNLMTRSHFIEILMILTKYLFDLGVRLTEFSVTVESVTLRFYCSLGTTRFYCSLGTTSPYSTPILGMHTQKITRLSSRVQVRDRKPVAYDERRSKLDEKGHFVNLIPVH